MFANPDGCDEKMSTIIKIISLHNGNKVLEKQFKNETFADKRRLRNGTFRPIYASGENFGTQ